MREGRGGLGASSSKSLDTHLLCMKSLGFFDPFIDGGGNGGHREDHSGDLLINAKRELIDEGDVISSPSLAGKILKVCDILLESIICNSIRVVDDLLNKFRKVQVGSGFGIEGVKGSFKVFSKFVEDFVRGFDEGVSHLVIPYLSERGTLSFTHLVESGHNLVVIKGVEGGIDGEVGLDGFNLLGCIK